jgi:thiol-disulfide isomerase/thioredoxin
MLIVYRNEPGNTWRFSSLAMSRLGIGMVYFGLPEVHCVEKMKLLPASGMFIVLIILMSGCSRFLSESEIGVQVGQPAPNFKLMDLHGQEVSLDQFKGRVVLLDFWATWCGPCRMTMPLVDRLQKEYSSSLVLLAVNLQDNKEEVEDFVYKLGLNSQVLLDEKGSVGQTYGAAAIPMEVLIDKQGVVRDVIRGFDPRTTMTRLRAEIEQLR